MDIWEADSKRIGEGKMEKTKMPELKQVVFGAGFVITFVIWLLIFAVELSAFSLLRTAFIISFGYVAMVYDINTKRIPNMLVSLMVLGWVMLIVPMLFIETQSAVKLIAESLLGLLIGGGLFLLVYIISRRGLGGGDVKFMAAAGLYLGLGETIPAILYGTVLAAITGLILLILKKIGSKDTMPLAPFLFIGIMITVFTK